jgi:hypothetical protein
MLLKIFLMIFLSGIPGGGGYNLRYYRSVPLLSRRYLSDYVTRDTLLFWRGEEDS